MWEANLTPIGGGCGDTNPGHGCGCVSGAFCDLNQGVCLEGCANWADPRDETGHCIWEVNQTPIGGVGCADTDPAHGTACAYPGYCDDNMCVEPCG